MPDPIVVVADLVDEPEDGRQVLNDDLGLTSFGLSLMVFRAGQRWRIHAHERQEEVYLVLSGRLTLLVEDTDGLLCERAISAWQLVRVAPGIRRQVVNRGPEPLRFIAVGAVGRHERRDAVAWNSWEETGEGLPPQDVPLPDDLPT